MATCTCNIAANFPISTLGIISASLRVNTGVILTSEGIVLEGPTLGDLSVTAYAPLEYEILGCPGKAGVSYQWLRKYDCDANVMHFIPSGNDQAFVEGDVTNKIGITTINTLESFSASAGSGPTTVYLKSDHSDGYEFSYSGGPFPITGRDATTTAFNSILPTNSTLYLISFNWEYTPPNVPTVSYSFAFLHSAP